MTKIFLKSRYSEWVSETKPMKQTCRGEDELRQTEDEREDKDHLIPSITSATRCTCWRGESSCTGRGPALGLSITRQVTGCWEFIPLCAIPHKSLSSSQSLELRELNSTELLSLKRILR